MTDITDAEIEAAGALALVVIVLSMIALLSVALFTTGAASLMSFVAFVVVWIRFYSAIVMY